MPHSGSELARNSIHSMNLRFACWLLAEDLVRDAESGIGRSSLLCLGDEKSKTGAGAVMVKA